MSGADRSDTTADRSVDARFDLTGGHTDRTPDSPWAPGGSMSDVPFRSEPTAGRAARRGTTLTRGVIDDVNDRPKGLQRRTVTIAAAALALVTVAAIVTTTTTTTTTTTSGDAGTRAALDAQLPDQDDPPPAADTTDPPATTAAPPTTTTPADTAAFQARSAFTIDVDGRLGEIAPTEIIGLGVDGNLYEISFPSGRVRVTDLGFDSTDSQLAANDDAAVVWPTPRGSAYVSTVVGPIAIPTQSVDSVSLSAGARPIYLWAESDDGTTATASLLDVDQYATVGTDTVQLVNLRRASWLDPTDGVSSIVDFDGNLVRPDAGGAYRLSEVGVERITTGEVVATGRNHLLMRACDEQRNCEVVAASRNGNRTQWADDLPSGVVPQLSDGISPQGDALIVATPVGDGQVGTAVVELSTMAAPTPLHAVDGFDGTALWANDGSGLFVNGPELLFVDRSTGDTSPISADLPRLRSIAVRQPAATPVCELLAITEPRFEAMRDSGDDSIGPPAEETLRRLVELAPNPLAETITPAVDFIGEFVTAGVARSQNVANFPGRVVEGLDAMTAYAAEQCPLVPTP